MTTAAVRHTSQATEMRYADNLLAGTPVCNDSSCRFLFGATSRYLRVTSCSRQGISRLGFGFKVDSIESMTARAHMGTALRPDEIRNSIGCSAVSSPSENPGEHFIGIILLPIVGNACEHAAAVRFAMQETGRDPNSSKLKAKGPDLC